MPAHLTTKLFKKRKALTLIFRERRWVAQTIPKGCLGA
jgi:hypothetical protein